MSIHVRPVRSDADRDRFLALPDRIYRDDRAWIPPLRREERKRIDPTAHPFFAYGHAELFLAERDGEPVGRISAQINPLHDAHHNERAGFFGFFEAVDDPAVAAALFDAAEAWLRAEGATFARGPFSYSINEEAGLLVSGFNTPPTVAMGHARPYYARLITGHGYTKVKDLWAWSFPMGEVPERFTRARAAIHRMPNVRVRPFERKHLQRDVRIAIEIFNDAWHDNWGFVPVTDREADHLAANLRQFTNPATTAIVEIDGEPAAMIVGITDLNDLIRDLNGRLFPFGWAKLLWRIRRGSTDRGRTVLMGVKQAYRTRELAGLSLMLPAEMNALGLAHGFRWAELGWILEDNRAMNNILERTEAHVYKTYRVYEKPL